MDEVTLPFDAFWSWLTTHPNCILRAGTSEAVVHDEEDLHWVFGVEDQETLLVQVLRGKRPLAEILVRPENVAYVQGSAGENDDEYFFDLILENAQERAMIYFFVLAHGFDAGDETGAPRVH